MAKYNYDNMLQGIYIATIVATLTTRLWQPACIQGCHNIVDKVVTTLTSSSQGCANLGNMSIARLKQAGCKVAATKVVQPCNNLVAGL